MIVVTGSVRAREETFDEVLRLSLEHVHRSRAEPGCLLHSVHRDTEDPFRLVFLEQWADADALAAHFAVPASLGFVTEVSALAAEPPTMDVLDAEPHTEVAALVHRFYDEAWNRWDDDVVDVLLGPDFAFRGSLGDESIGRQGFRAYRDKIRARFPDFRTEVVDVVVSGARAVVRLRCIAGPDAYDAAAMFRVEGRRLAEAWVVGDLEPLRRQAGGP